MRAGSITVAELIKNRPTPVRLPSRDDEPQTEEMVMREPEPSRQDPAPNTHRRTPARTKQLAKLAGLGVAAAVLCASVAAASIITTKRQAATDAAARPAIEMTDEQAMLPNLFTLGTATGPERKVTTELPAPNTGSAAASVDSPGAGRVAQPEPKRPVTGHQVTQEPVNAELVRRYYDLLASQPSQALGLLDSVLRTSDLSHFVDSWTQVRGIKVLDVQQRTDGTLLAVVSMVLPNGGTARVQQLLRLTETMPQRITGAEIISAQQS
ncbi:hypothetical protein [Actinocrispum sp. NPDC049592]|uniref:hypothetical protein n=1 Tax=Actinocrispum sp. NPDC049592 TaxID=3154835 RepID=UPI003424B526